MVAAKKYEPVGRCIYCGAEHYAEANPSAKLGDEHIISLAFGGNLLLPEASCRTCEKITSAIETHCVEQMIRDTREHLGLHPRRHKKARKTLPINVDHGTHTETRRVPLGEHPAALFMFGFDPPGSVLGLADTEQFAGRVVIRPMTADFGARASRLGQKINLVRRGGFDALIFGRMLAKIAHSFAVAELGLKGFKPLLTDLILGHPPLRAAQLVGSALLPEPVGSERHEISIKPSSRFPDGWRYLLVRLRLFADLDMPVYHIVVGEQLGQTQPTTTHQDTDEKRTAV